MQPVTQPTFNPNLPLTIGDAVKNSVRPHGIPPETAIAIRPIFPEHIDIESIRLETIKDSVSFVRGRFIKEQIAQRRYNALVADMRNNAEIMVPVRRSLGVIVDILV